jgi:microcystin-dependent protein
MNNLFSLATLLLLIAAICLFLGLTIGFKISQDEGDTNLRADLSIVSEDLILLNDSLCAKIMNVNTSLQNEVNQLVQILESSNSSFYFDLGQAINNTNTTLQTKIMNGDIDLQIQITNLTTVVGEKLVTVNSVQGDPSARNIDLVANGTGFAVQPNPLTNSIYLENTGVASVNAVPSLAGSHDLLLTGAGMITINSYPLTSTVEVDGTTLSTAIYNLQMQNNMQQMEIATLEGNVTNLQTQITNIQLAGDMIAQDLNGTTLTFNMTLMTLVMDVMTLQSQVVALQSQIMALTSAAVPPGTITPFGGTVIPSGYLACDGAEYDTTTYAALFTVIGTMYCPGPCTNMSVFAVPDLRGRVPAGQGGTALMGPLGSVVGAETHTLSSAEMPSHSHTATIAGVGNHNHQISGNFPKVAYYYGAYTGMDTFEDFGGAPNWQMSNLNFDGAHTHSITIDSTGSSSAHNNIQPSLVVKYIIRT